MKQWGEGEKKNGNVSFYTAFYVQTAQDFFLNCETKPSVV